MTLRATFLGLLFALFISVVVYFNDHVIQQTYLIGNHFPIVVFGVLIILVLFINPLLGRLGLRRTLTPKEIACIGALGLVVCGWPGSGFFRGFTALVAMPSNMLKVNASWKATQVMSYVPGASCALGEGHVLDWTALGEKLMGGSREQVPSPQRRLWERLPDGVRGMVAAATQRGRFEQSEKMILLNAVNEILASPSLYAADAFAGIGISDALRAKLEHAGAQTPDKDILEANRLLLVAAFPSLIAPPPPGRGVLLADGNIEDPAVQSLLQGKEGSGIVGLSDIPWRTWFPTLLIWGGLALLLGVAVVCLVVLLQPQWKRELLPYPIARFVGEIAEPARPGGPPAVLANKLFWYGFAAMIIIHLVNGLYQWFPTFVQIPLKFDFSPLAQLFPRARQFWWGGLMVWSPTLYPTVIAFAFFLSAEVSFSVGIAGPLYLVVFSMILASGITLERDWLESGNENLLRFGSYVGIALTMLYIGRRYYFNVIAGSLGLRRHSETPSSAVWAARLLYGCIICAAALLAQYGVDWYFGLLLVMLMLLLFVVMTRVNAETGSLFMQPFWMPLGVFTTLFGIQAIGPTAYLVMAMMCMVIAGDPRECVMPFVANAMHMVTSPSEKKPPGRFAILIGAVVVGGFVVALCATLFYQYNYGINHWDSWAVRAMPSMPFGRLANNLSELSAYGELSRSVAAQGLARLALARPNWSNIIWIFAGVGLVVVCSTLRLRFSWWPLHPIAFVVWGTFPHSCFTMSFLAGWLIKASVMKMSGARGYRIVKPFMVGIISGELFAAIGWSVFGVIYHFITNLIPISYRIFPG